MVQKVKKAVFPVAGLGTRFLPATKSMPKEMLTVVDKPLIHYAVEEAKKAGVEEFIFVTGRGKSAIEDYFDYNHELHHILKSRGKEDLWDEMNASLPRTDQIAYVRQSEPLGLGHAVWCARNLIGNEPFAVMLADELFLSDETRLSQLLKVYEKTGGHVIAAMEVEKNQTGSYGIFDVENRDGHLIRAKGMVEKPAPENAPSQMAVVGPYILQASVMDYLDKGITGAGGEIQLTDAIVASMQETAVHGVAVTGQRFDCGNRRGFLEANIVFALQRPDLKDAVQDILKIYDDKDGLKCAS